MIETLKEVGLAKLLPLADFIGLFLFELFEVGFESLEPGIYKFDGPSGDCFVHLLE